MNRFRAKKIGRTWDDLPAYFIEERCLFIFWFPRKIVYGFPAAKAEVDRLNRAFA